MICEFNEFLMLNESSIYDMEFRNISVDDIFSMWDTPYHERFVEGFKYISYQYDLEDLDDVDNDEIEEMPEYKEWLKRELEDIFDDIMDNIDSKIKDGQLTIWRVITVNEKWLDHFIKYGKHLGICWSWEESAAEAHGGYGSGKRIEVRFQCIIDERQVNWKDTVVLNMHPGLGEEEKEIRLVKNTRLKLDKLEIGTENFGLKHDKVVEYDISNLKNRVFLS